MFLFFIMLESPVQIDTAFLTIFDVGFMHRAALWTRDHGRLLSLARLW